MRRTKPKTEGFVRQSAFFKADGDYDIVMSPDLPSGYIFGVELDPLYVYVTSETSQGTKHIQYEVPVIPNPFDYAIVFFNWGPENGYEIDSRIMVLNPPRYVDVGWARENSDPTSNNQVTNPNEYYIGHITARDTTNANGPEIFFINFKKLAEDYPEIDVFNIDIRSFWYGSSFSAGGDGVLSIDVSTYLGGVLGVETQTLGGRSAGVYVNYGGELTNSFNYTLRLNTDGVFQNVPGEEVGTMSYDRKTKSAAFFPFPNNFFYPETVEESVSASGELSTNVIHEENAKNIQSSEEIDAEGSPPSALEYRENESWAESTTVESVEALSTVLPPVYSNSEMYLVGKENLKSNYSLTDTMVHVFDLVSMASSEKVVVTYSPSPPIHYRRQLLLPQSKAESVSGDSGLIDSYVHIHEIGGEYALSENLSMGAYPSVPVTERFLTDTMTSTPADITIGGANVSTIIYKRDP